MGSVLNSSRRLTETKWSDPKLYGIGSIETKGKEGRAPAQGRAGGIPTKLGGEPVVSFLQGVGGQSPRPPQGGGGAQGTTRTHTIGRHSSIWRMYVG